MKRIALVTQLSADGTPLISTDSRAIAQYPDLLTAHGLTLTDAAWEDPSVDWQAFDALVIKSTWNYHLPENAAAFNRWLDSVSGPTSQSRQRAGGPVTNSICANLKRRVAVVPSVWRDVRAPLDVQAAIPAG